MTNRKIIGIVLIIISLAILLFLFTAYSIANFVVSNVETDNLNQISNIANNNSAGVITNESVSGNLPSTDVKLEINRIIKTSIIVLSIPGLLGFLIGFYLLIKSKNLPSNPPQDKTKL